MDYCKQRMFTIKAAISWLSAPLLLMVSGCDSSLVQQAKVAEKEGAIINNEIMLSMYPKTFRAGAPAYLERDFEAGADFICAEIKAKYEQDVCSEPEINWK